MPQKEDSGRPEAIWILPACARAHRCDLEVLDGVTPWYAEDPGACVACGEEAMRYIRAELPSAEAAL